MQRKKLLSHRLVAAFLLGCVLFNYPVLAVFDRIGMLGGLPSTFVWLMSAWVLLIVLMAWIVETADGRE